MPGTCASVFVYGTLMPGRLRWPLVADDVVARAPDSVRAVLLDTGRGYPAARLDPGGSTHGWVLELRASTVATVLDRLDRVEGPDYQRTTVTTAAGRAVHLWIFTGDPTGFVPLPDGRWPDGPER
jgi:gamma-glutamylcyclotransferase (GGCT)/AIG2-like uncharacterized protein YtfP